MINTLSWREFRNSNWRAVRKRGILRFISVNGILSFGIPMAIVTAILEFEFGTPGTDSWREYLMSNGTWIGYIFLALVTGVIFGVLVWFFSERSYRSSIESESEIDEV